MVMGDYDCACSQLESALDYFPRVDRRMVDGAALVQFVGDQVVALVQEQHPELFAGLERHDGPQVIKDCSPRRQCWPVLELAMQHSQCRCPNCRQVGGCLL